MLSPPGRPYTKLKKSAVPSKFNFPCHLLPKAKSARRPIAYVKPPNVAANTVLKRNETFNIKEHSYCKKAKTATKSPTKAKLRKKIKTLQQKLRRRNLKICSLTGLIKDMRNRKLLEKAPAELLQDQFSGLTLDMFQNQIKNSARKPGGKRYNEEIKKICFDSSLLFSQSIFVCEESSSSPPPSIIKKLAVICGM